MNKKKIKLLVQNIENLVELLKIEIGDDEDEKEHNTISIKDLIHKPDDLESDVEYYEEEEGPEILLNNKEERDFYENFRLGE